MKKIFLPLKSRMVGILLFAATQVSALDVVPLPSGLVTQWDAVPVENYGGEHAVKVINGLWRFQPGDPEADINSSQPEDQWSHMWIPGSWHSRPNWNETGLVVDGTTPLWKRYIKKHREWPVGWFEREVAIPSDWDGRAVFVEFSEISTRAQVWLDGNWCGALQEEKGRVELTQHIRAGETQLLRVQVLAVPPEEPILLFMGEASEQIFLKPAKLRHFGLVRDVFLVTEPFGPNLEDVRVITSVSDEKFSISAALDEDISEGKVRLAVQVEDLDGKVIQKFAERSVSVGNENSFYWSEDWVAERLWDTDDPYLMKVRIRATGKGWSDERLIRFGFREFEVRGKEFYLNGKAIRLRPTPHIDMPQIEAVVKQWMHGIKSIGFNMKMTEADRSPETMIKMGDELGVLMFVELPEIKDYVGFNGLTEKWDENKADWQRRMSREISRLYNHPSIVMWWSGFNVFAHGEDQNPARIGQLDKMMVEDEEWNRRVKIGWEAMDMMRAEDPSRGVYSHNGSIVGDIQTTNVYLCIHPLQEREEWLSEWAEKGDMPFLACEFGLPLDNTFMQGRAGGGWTTLTQGKNAQGSANSAMMLTEYSAIYLGPEAYELQTEFYADGIIESHFEGFIHDRNAGLGGWDSDLVDPLQRMIRSDAYQKIQVLFNENSFRSWRGFGMTGGVNPWSFQNHTHIAQSWRKNQDNMPMGPFVPGTRGKYRPEISKGLYYNVMEGGWPKLPAYYSLTENNQELLSFIGGDAEQSFTDKDHQFFSGGRIAKQVVFINDKRHPVDFHAIWTIDVGGQTVSEGKEHMTLEPGKNGFAPFEALLPQVSEQKVDGVIRLSVEASGKTMTDRFEFTVYPMESPLEVVEKITKETVIVEEAKTITKKPGFWKGLFGAEAEIVDVPAKTKVIEKKTYVSQPKTSIANGEPVMLVEGDGATRAWLAGAGNPAKAWDPSSKLPLFIGRGALTTGEVQLAELRDWVHTGGVVVISSPAPEWVRDQLGMRVTPHPSRRVFPTAQPHAISEGFTTEDLRDWNASSTTVDGFNPHPGETRKHAGKPYYGWRWGNRGSVASFMMEKPHHAGWSPIFEGEFDLAYSPLMELPFGQGRVIISTFDLEDNVGVTPAADVLANRLVDYAFEMRGASEMRGFIAYRGENKWKHIFPKMGAYLTDNVEEANILVLGKGHGVNDTDLRLALGAGRNVLLLRGAELPSFTGWSWNTSAGDFYGTTDIPLWPEIQGLSTGDFHSRAPYPFWRIDGEGVGGEGMLARKEVGKGVIMATAFDPTWIRSDQQPFMRLTKWRHSRNIVSLISSLGGAFELDSQIFDLQVLPTGKIPLEGEWRVKWTNPVEAAKKPGVIKDPGISDAALAAVHEDAYASSGWGPYTVPSDADSTSPEGGSADGELVLQRKVYIPQEWSDEDLVLNLARIDDHDQTFWNGEKVGSIAEDHPKPWSAIRIYSLPAEKIEPGENTLSIRVMDLFGGSGITSKEHPVHVIRPDDKNLQFYHPDYRRDWAYGDDAYRYYRW